MTFARALPLFVTLPLLFTTGAGRAEAVYRCSGPAGTGTHYSQQPCPGGRSVDVQDTRSDEQVRAARADAAQEAVLADRLTREREQREARVRPGGAVAIRGERGTGGVRPAAAATTPPKASADSSPRKKRKKAVKATKTLKQPA